MIDLQPQETQLILDSLNLISIKGGDAKFVAKLQLDLEGHLEDKLKELNLEKEPIEQPPTGNEILKSFRK